MPRTSAQSVILKLYNSGLINFYVKRKRVGLKLLGEDFQDFITQRYRRHLRVKFLTNRVAETIALKRRDVEELREMRFLPESFIVKNANFVYGDKIAIMSLNKKLPVGMIIEDKDIAHTQMMLFETIWAQSGA